MKLRITNIKLNNESYTEAKKFSMFMPADFKSIVSWLEDANVQPFTVDNAIDVYVRTAILYGNYKLDYDVSLVFDETVESTERNQYIVADMIDERNNTYAFYRFDLRLPAEVVVDTRYYDYDEEDLKFVIFTLLLDTLKFTVRDLERI